MSKQITASHAKNNFGGLLEDAAALGRVDIVRHGRVVAVVLSPRALEALSAAFPSRDEPHMIPPALARAARMRRPPRDFGDD